MQIASVTLLDEARGGRPTCAIIIDAEIYWPLTEYFRERNFSIESERAYANAIWKFMSWMNAKELFQSQDIDGTSPGQRARKAMNSFLHDLLYGTAKVDQDDSGLWWGASNHKAVALASSRIASFSDWLAEREEDIAHPNPKGRSAQASERIIAMRHHGIKKRASMMGHAKSSDEAARKKVRLIRAPGRDSEKLPEVAAFPVEKIEELIWKGFEREQGKNDPRPWVRWNLRDILVTLVCLYGGTRESEPLHLWTEDVLTDPASTDSCKLLIHHPETGIVEHPDPVSGKMVRLSRADYLNRFCGGKRPLTQETGRRHSGWKGNLLTDRQRNAFQVFWIDPEAGKLFKRLWSLYLLHQRPCQPNTPWAFLTKDGQPYGAQAFSSSFEAAVRKIGLTPSKWLGTTPHGLRHRYGQWLNDLGIADKHGQICMHHASVFSQEVYRQFTIEQVAGALAEKAMKSPILLPSNALGDGS